jgi:dipeptidase E
VEMKLVLYSGGNNLENFEMDTELKALFTKENPSITFIPSSFDDASEDFDEFCSYYEKYHFTDFSIFPLDVPFNENSLDKIFKRDMIYLAGGNTYYFLKYLRKSGFKNRIGHFLRRGGILVGQSAGAIVMTPNILTAGFPSFDKDENEVKIKNLTGFKLVNFEFFPHYIHSRRYIDELQRYSRISKNPVLACYDGSGVVINGQRTTFVGKVYLFHGGIVSKLSNA